MYRDASAAVRLHPETVAVLAGRPTGAGEPLNQPPVFASSFGSGEGAEYGRSSNPTWNALEDALGALDRGSAVCFASGMAAASAIADLLEPGSRVLVCERAYVEVRRLLGARAAAGRLELTEIDSRDTAGVVDALGVADVLWVDAISNPGLEVPELDLILAAARSAGVLAVVDSTLATPISIRPLELGADLVLHSAGKYIGGHSDLVLGAAVAADPRVAARLRRGRTASGAVPGTMEAWLALRGLRTLPLRAERGSASAAALAQRLAAHPEVEAVRHPGRPGDPASAAAARILALPGAVVSFELAGADRADAVCVGVELITHTASLGGVETLIERQGRWQDEPSVPSGLLRLSVGCEHLEDLWRDLDRALCA